MEKLNTLRISISLTLTATVTYLAFVLWFYISPESGYAFFQNLIHGIGLTTRHVFESRAMTFSDLLLGLSSCVTLSFVAGALFCIVFNRTVFRRKRDDPFESSISRPIQL